MTEALEHEMQHQQKHLTAHKAERNKHSSQTRIRARNATPTETQQHTKLKIKIHLLKGQLKATKLSNTNQETTATTMAKQQEHAQNL